MNRIKEYIKKTLNKYNFIISHKNSWYARQENYIAEINEDEKKIFRIVDNYSMCTEANRWVIVQAVNHIIKNNLEGDFVESGVFKGGNLILFNYLINKFKLNKKIYAYDTFEGMPESGMHDLDLKNIPAKETQKKYDNAKIKWCYENLEEVKQNIKKYDKEFEKKFIFIKGNVLKTLKIKENVPEKISL